MTERSCECKLPEKWAKDPYFPVQYDPQMDEYSVVHGKKRKGYWLMHYCPACGGRLPESRRGDFFTEPEEGELQEAKALLRDIHDVASMRAVLGEPDRVDTWESDEESERDAEIYGSQRWTRAYTYERRWKTLCVAIGEMDDGRVSVSIYGKYKGGTGRVS